MPVKKDIEYPVFLECCTYVKDDYWRSIFEDLAYGIAPRGTFISKGNLCCRLKKSIFNYVIIESNPKELYDGIYDKLSGKIGLVSHQEHVEKITKVKNLGEELSSHRIENWKNIKKKNVKDALIHMYICRKQKKHKLTAKQSKHLLSIVFIGMAYKTITPSDINYANGKITDIKGILFKDNKIILNKTIYGKNASFTDDEINEKKLMSCHWNKYIESIKK